MLVIVCKNFINQIFFFSNQCKQTWAMKVEEGLSEVIWGKLKGHR